MHSKVAAGGLGVPHSPAGKPEGTTRERDRPHNPGFQHTEIKPPNLWLQNSEGVAAAAEIPSLTGESVGRAYGVLEYTQAQTPGNQHQNGPICLWVAGEVIEGRGRAK